MPDAVEKVYLLQIINVVAAFANAFELLIMLTIGYVDAKNEKSLANTTWDTNDMYEDVLDTRDYDGTTIVIPVLHCKHYGQSHGVISLINNPKWSDSTVGHINPLNGTYPKNSVVQIYTRHTRLSMMLMSEKLCGEMWAPIVIALAMGLTSSLLGIITYGYAYSEALIGGIAAVTLSPTTVGFFSCIYYITKICRLTNRTFDMHDIEIMRKRSGDKSLKRMILVKEKTTLQITTSVRHENLRQYFRDAMGIEDLLKILPSKLKNTASMRAQNMIRKANHMKAKIDGGSPLLCYRHTAFVRLSSILEKVNGHENKHRLCKNAYNAAICKFQKCEDESNSTDGFPVTRFEDEQVVREIIQQAIPENERSRVSIKTSTLLSNFFDLQNVRQGQRSDWSNNGEVDGW